MPVQDGISNRLVMLEGAFGRVFEQAMDWADEDFRREIEAIKWKWKGSDYETLRENGETVTEPRNIVDTGDLRNSQRRENQTAITTDFVWTGGDGEEYASIVHDGYVSKLGGRYPARPFTNNAIQELPSIVETLLMREVVTNG